MLFCKFSVSDEFLIKSASFLSVLISVLVLLIKLVAWSVTNSQSILVSLIDSMLDIFSSVVNLIAIRVSFMPADDKHRFGHDKFQDLAVFFQSIFFLTSCSVGIFSAFRSLVGGLEVTSPFVGIQSMYICTFLTLVLVSYQYYVVFKTKSRMIFVDRLHYVTDLFGNVVVLISLYIGKEWKLLDPIVAICIAIYLVYSSYKLLLRSISSLADEEVCDDDKTKIIEIIRSQREVMGLHEFKTRNAGDKIFIQFHVELDGAMSLHNAHEIADEISNNISKVFPKSEIIIHQDPAGLESDVQYKEEI